MTTYVSDPALLQRLRTAAQTPQTYEEIQRQRVAFALSNIKSERENTRQIAEKILASTTK